MANGLFNLKQVMQAVQQGGWPAQKTPAVEYLVVAGGGGGGNTTGGGGGAGGLLTGIDPVPNGQTLLVTVGSGGAGSSVSTTPGGNGTSSVFGAISTTGGGGGGAETGTSAGSAGQSGGSGGGAGYFGGSSPPAGQGVAGQGNVGGLSPQVTSAREAQGGGGGAGTAGLPSSFDAYGGNGGAGIASAISGTVTAYAGGGGGAGNTIAGGVGGTGGVGGGGNGGTSAVTSPTSGTANTGGGGGGSRQGVRVGGNGGTGIVIVSYPDVYAAATATTGSPTVSTSGSGSIKFAYGQYFYYNAQSGFSFGTGDFTIEFFINVNVLDGSFAHGIISFPANSTIAAPLIYLNGDNTIRYGNYSTEIVGSVLSVGTWYHIAVCRSSGVSKLYINGTQSGSNLTDTGNYGVGANNPVIGGSVNSSGTIQPYLNAYISNMRILKGTALYTANFTAPIAPLTAITNTQLLLNSNSGAYLADNSANSLTQTSTVGPPIWNASSPFAVTGYKNRVYTWTSSGSITF
jgi:hypothetical protein